MTRARASALLKPPMGPETGPVTVVGLPGCVAGEGTVSIESLGTIYTASASAQGSFIAEGIVAKADEKLALRFRASDPAYKIVQARGVAADRPPEPIPGVPPLTAIGGDRIRIEGHTLAGAGKPVFAINLRTLTVAEATSDASANFQLELEAAGGDSLSIYDDDEPLGAAWTLAVP